MHFAITTWLQTYSHVVREQRKFLAFCLSSIHCPPSRACRWPPIL